MHPQGELERSTAYDGEDTRITSKKELSGWYSYGFAAEVFVVCGVGMADRAAAHDDLVTVLIRIIQDLLYP